MKKYIIPLLILIPIAIIFYRCANTSNAAIVNGLSKKQVTKTILSKNKINTETETFLNNQQVITLFKNKDYATQGFYGKNNEYIAYYITSAITDKTDKSLIHIKGFDKYKNTVTPMDGDFKIENVTLLNTEDKTSKSYYINGHWIFNEATAAKNTGIFEGKFGIDATINDDKELYVASYLNNGKTKNNGLLLDGHWTNYNNPNDVKEVTFTANVHQLGNKIFKHFTYGEREETINPEYAKYGWSEEYLYEEWWLSDAQKKAKE
jgi:hypothetical protein